MIEIFYVTFEKDRLEWNLTDWTSLKQLELHITALDNKLHELITVLEKKYK